MYHYNPLLGTYIPLISVHPTQLKKGYGSMMLQLYQYLLLQQNLGTRLLVWCSKNNNFGCTDISTTTHDNDNKACGIYTFMSFFNILKEYVEHYPDNIPKDSLFRMPYFEYGANVWEKSFNYWLKAAYVVHNHVHEQN